MKRRGFKIEKLLTPRGINVLVDSPAGHVHHHGIMYTMDVDGVIICTRGRSPLFNCREHFSIKRVKKFQST